MRDRDDQARLLERVRSWFDEPEQVDHYQEEAAAGPTGAELWLLRWLPPTGRVLDVGCGAGRIVRFLSARGYTVIGTDVSAPLLRASVQPSGSERSAGFVQVEPLRLPVLDGVFDAAVAFKVYCYVPTWSSRLAYLSEIHRTLRPGGLLLLSQHVAPEEAYAHYRDQYYEQGVAGLVSIELGDTFPLGRGYVHWFTSAQLRQELRASPFEIVAISNDHAHGGAGFIDNVVLRRMPVARLRPEGDAFEDVAMYAALRDEWRV